MTTERPTLTKLLRTHSNLPSMFQWTGTDMGLEGLFDAELRHKAGSGGKDYLAAWLQMLRPFAFATKDDSWGEMEKLLCIVMRNYVRMKELCAQAADAIASRDAEIERLRQVVTLQEIDRKANLHAAREQLRENSAEFKKLNAALGEAERALEVNLKAHIDLAESGDAGFWDPEKTPEVMATRAALSTIKTAREG